MRYSVPVLAVLLFAPALACDTGVENGGSSNPSTDCIEAENHSDLAFVQQKVFTPSCANFTACHKGNATSARRLNLEAESNEAAFVRKLLGNSQIVDELGLPQKTILKPGDPDNSYLVVIMEGKPSNLLLEDADGPVTMPLRAPLLCAQKIGAVRRWIQGVTPAI